jgi:hypothetical protein
VLGKDSLGGMIMATPAIAHGSLLVGAGSRLYRIAKKRRHIEEICTMRIRLRNQGFRVRVTVFALSFLCGHSGSEQTFSLTETGSIRSDANLIEVAGPFAYLPPELEKPILRCLRKDPARRYQTMADLKVALEDLQEETSAPQSQHLTALAARPDSSGRRAVIFRLALSAAVILAAVTSTLLLLRVWQRAPEARPAPTVKFTFTPHSLRRGGADFNVDSEVSISPDGKHITYVEVEGGQLWVRDIDQEQAHIARGPLVYARSSDPRQSAGWIAPLLVAAGEQEEFGPFPNSKRGPEFCPNSSELWNSPMRAAKWSGFRAVSLPPG